jgi:hypothetical protein
MAGWWRRAKRGGSLVELESSWIDGGVNQVENEIERKRRLMR